MNKPKTPEYNRLVMVVKSVEGEAIENFVYWLGNEKQYSFSKRCTVEHEKHVICYACGGTGFVLVHERFDRLLAEYYRIDLDKVESERVEHRWGHSSGGKLWEPPPGKPGFNSRRVIHGWRTRPPVPTLE